MVSRRAFVMSSLATLALPRLMPEHSAAFASWRSPAPAPAPRQFADVPLQSVKVRDNVFFITERGGNSMLIVTRDGPVLIDTKMPTSGRLLLDESKKQADGSAPRFVINTHHHFDHTGGNSAFDDTAEMIAHRNLSPRMQAHLEERIKPAIATEASALRNSGKTREADELVAWAAALAADDFKADRDFTDTLELDIGGVKIALRHFGNGHTDNDTVVFLPELNVLATGDLFFNGSHVFIDRPAGATTVGWRNSVRKIIDLCDDKTIIIPGHGPLADKATLPKQIAYFDQMQAIVEQAIKDGRSKDTVSAMTPEQFKGLAFEMLLPGTLTAVYEEVSETMN